MLASKGERRVNEGKSVNRKRMGSIVDPDPSLNSLISEISDISIQSSINNNTINSINEKSMSQLFGSPMNERSTSHILGSPIYERSMSPINNEGSMSQILGSPIKERRSSQIVGTPINNEGSMSQISGTTIKERRSSQIVGTPIMNEGSMSQILGTPIKERRSSQILGSPIKERRSSQILGTPIKERYTSQVLGSPVSERNSQILATPIIQSSSPIVQPLSPRSIHSQISTTQSMRLFNFSPKPKRQSYYSMVDYMSVGMGRRDSILEDEEPEYNQEEENYSENDSNIVRSSTTIDDSTSQQNEISNNSHRQQNSIAGETMETMETMEPIEPIESIEPIKPIKPIRKQTFIEEPIEAIEPPIAPIKKPNISPIIIQKPKRNSQRSSVRISLPPPSPASVTCTSTYDKLTSNSRYGNRPKSLMSEASTKSTIKGNRTSKSASVDFSVTTDGSQSTTSVRRKIFSMLFMPGNSRSSKRASTRSSSLFGSSNTSARSSRLFGKSGTSSTIMSLDRKRRKRTLFTDLPDNVIQLIFKYIGETFPIEFKHTCRKTYQVGNHPDTIAKWLYYYYDPKVLTIPETDQQIAFKKRVIVTNEVIASIVNKIDENVVEDFDDNLKNSMTIYALRNDDLHLLQALFKPFCFNVEVGLVSVACQNQNRTSQEFITYLFEKDFILPKSTFYEACLRFNTYVINCYLRYNDITHKEIDDYFKDVEKRPFHPMVAAARSGDLDLIRNIIEGIGCSISLFGYHAFIKAISHNKLAVAKYLFNIYPQLDMNDNEMMNIVSKAAERGRLETLRFIKYVYDKRYGKARSINCFRKPGNLANAITASALAGQLECCVWLMERERRYISPEYANRILDCFANHIKGKSDLPLIHRARFLQYLARYPTNFKGPTGYDILKTSIIHDDVESISVLLDHGINVHADNEHALQFACGLGKTKAVQYLLERGAQPNKYVSKILKKGFIHNGNIIRLDREKRDEVSRILSMAKSSKRFTFRK